MNPWETLGIAPTQDKKEIKKAYAKLTKKYHPEENPKEFQKIQQAFQACLNNDYHVEETVVEKTIYKSEEENREGPPVIPQINTLFSETKDECAYSTLLVQVDDSLPEKLDSKTIINLFSNPSIMPYLEDEAFCAMLENVLLKHSFKYVKKQDDAVFRYLSKYDMKQLREVIDYANVPYYQKTAFYILVVIFVVCVITFFSI